MEEIIKTLLMEGIDENTIHKVLDVIEEEYEVVDETKKANKEAHQEAIFKKVNPNGKDVYYDKDEEPINKEEKEARERVTNKRPSPYVGSTIYGKTNSMKDYRAIHRTDDEDNAPYYDYDTRKDERSTSAEYVRDALGRDKEFSAKEPEASKSHQAAQAYNNYKTTLNNLKKK